VVWFPVSVVVVAGAVRIVVVVVVVGGVLVNVLVRGLPPQPARAMPTASAPTSTVQPEQTMPRP
jgi:hypothetical protein